MSAAGHRPDPDYPPLGGVLDFLRLLWAIDHGLQRVSKKMHATVGITGSQRFVLQIVGRFPGIPAGHLAELLHIHPSTLTTILKRLERRGLLRRRADPRDGRRSLLGLTARGRALDLEAAGGSEAAVRAALLTIAPPTLAAARDVLRSIADALASANGASLTKV